MKPNKAAPHAIPLANKPIASTVLTWAEEKRDRPTLPKKMKMPTKKRGFKRSISPRLPYLKFTSGTIICALEPSDSEIGSEAPFEPCLVCSISLFGGACVTA